MYKIEAVLRKFVVLLFSLVLLISSSFLFISSNVKAAPPPNFQITQVVGSGLEGPSGIGLAPDGRIFILQRTGEVKIYKNGSLLPNNFVVLPAAASGDRGLIGVVFDPDFSVNKYVYFYYTSASDLKNYLVRFSAIGDVATEGPVQIFQTENQSFQLHVGGGISFGPDEKIYIPIGDNGYPQNAQNLASLHGKILRINKDGTIPTDNPFYNVPGAQKAVWAWGLRNPYRIQFDSESGRLYAGDVGQSNWEEIDLIVKGGNYGWPICEADCETPNPNYIDPEYSYPHSGQSRAVTMGPVYKGGMFPQSYRSKAFFADYAAGFIKTLNLDSSGHATSVSDFDLAAGSVVDLKEATDGSIYYITYYPGRLYRISYSTTNPVPVASSGSNVTKGLAPLLVNFTSSGSFDPNGDSLSFNWDFGDGTSSNLPNPSKTYSQNGSYVVELTVSDGANSAQAIPIVIQVGVPPSVTIGQPVANSTYKAGDIVNYTVAALDGVGYDINDNGLSTEVLFHHETHIHPFLGPIIGRNGSFQIPTTGEQSADTWFEIKVTATDENGLSTTKSTFIYPETTQLTFTTNPPGLPITIIGQPFSTPNTVTSVVGFDWDIELNSPQYFSNGIYEFMGWNDGFVNTSRVIKAPDSPMSTFSANYNLIGTFSGFTGQYFSSMNLSGSPVLTRVDPEINFDWDEGSPSPLVPQNNFSVRWTSTIEFTPGTYRFSTTSDDGVRLKIDGVTVIDKWIDQGPTTYSVERQLSGEHDIVMEYFENSVGATAKLAWTKLNTNPSPTPTPVVPTPTPTPVVPTPTPTPTSGFVGEYFANKSLTGAPAFTRNDPQVNFSWGESSPAANFPQDDFSVRWTTSQNFLAGSYVFTVRADDGVRLYVDGVKIIDKWIDQGPTTYSINMNLTSGVHSVVMEYYEHWVGATANLSWVNSSVVPTPTPTPTPVVPTPTPVVPTPTPTPVVPTPTPISPAQTVFFGEYYKNKNLSGTPAFTRLDETVNFNWDYDWPDSRMGDNENYSVRWTGTLNAPTSATYKFFMNTDDGSKLKIDGTTVLDKWYDHGPTLFTVDVPLTAGNHQIVLEYYQGIVTALAQLWWVVQ